MKKIISTFMAVCMVFALATTAFAADTTSTSDPNVTIESNIIYVNGQAFAKINSIGTSDNSASAFYSTQGIMSPMADNAPTSFAPTSWYHSSHTWSCTNYTWSLYKFDVTHNTAAFSGSKTSGTGTFSLSLYDENGNYLTTLWNITSWSFTMYSDWSFKIVKDVYDGTYVSGTYSVVNGD